MVFFRKLAEEYGAIVIFKSSPLLTDAISYSSHRSIISETQPAMGKKPQKLALVKSVVSEEDLAEARTIMANGAELKRARSNMSYWLKQNGLEAEYGGKNMKARKEFLENWLADKLGKKKCHQGAEIDELRLLLVGLVAQLYVVVERSDDQPFWPGEGSSEDR